MRPRHFRAGGPITGLELLAGGHILAHRPSSVALFDAAGAKLWEGAPSVVAVSPAGDRFAVVELHPTRQSETIRVIEAATGAGVAHAFTMPNVQSLAFSPSGTQLGWAQFARPLDYGSIATWPIDAEPRDRVPEAGRCGPVAFLDEERLIAASGSDVGTVTDGAEWQKAGLWIEALYPSNGRILLADRGGAVVALGSGWSLPATPGAAEVRFDGVLVARWPHHPESQATSAIEWARIGDAGPASVWSSAAEGPWLGARWIPGAEALVAFTSRAVHVLDARIGEITRVWAAGGEPIVAIGAGAEIAWATADGVVWVTRWARPEGRLRKTVAGEEATLTFVDGDLVVPVFRGPEWGEELSQVAQDFRVEAELRNAGDQLLIVVTERAEIRAGSGTTAQVGRRAFVSDDGGRTWRAAEPGEAAVAALIARSGFLETAR